MNKLNLKAKYPQNYIIKKPVFGALILFAFTLVFTLLYHPLNSQKSFYFDFKLTMLFYSIAACFPAYLLIVLIKKLPFFSSKKDWTLLKEGISIYLVLQVMGVAIYLFAFIIENPIPETRWNLITFLDSCKYSFLIGIFPFIFFTAINYKFTHLHFKSSVDQYKNETEQELIIHISSSLKKESLSFYANELLFVTSDGNYVFFTLYRNKKVERVPLRNSISNIENQLQQIPYYFRCHRAYIVNLNRVALKKGNALGYILNLANCEDKIPVSRKNLKAFDTLFPE